MTDIQSSHSCPRCSATIVVRGNVDVGRFLTTSGWTRSATLRDQRAPLRLADGRTAVVPVAAYNSDDFDWHCSQRCALETASHAQRERHEWHVDGGSGAGKERLAAGSHSTPGDGRTAASERPHACPGCGAMAHIPVGYDAARVRAFLAAHGWPDGGPFCSARCRVVAGLRHADPPPVKTIADAVASVSPDSVSAGSLPSRPTLRSDATRTAKRVKGIA